MTPLNLFLRTTTEAAAELAVLDYGQSSATWPTRTLRGRSASQELRRDPPRSGDFYDYDELCQVTDCGFRDMPQATNLEDEMRGEAWFYVADNDIFFKIYSLNFLAFDDAQRAAFLRACMGRFSPRILAARAATADGRRHVECCITRIG